MANYIGTEGYIQVDGNTVAELNGWSVDTASNIIPNSNMSDTWDRNKVGRLSFSGSAECFWDPTDASGQEVIVAGATVTLTVYPTGAGTGKTVGTGVALLAGVNIAAGDQAVISRSFSFIGDGSLVWSTLA